MNSRTVRKTARHSAGKSFFLSLLFIGVQFGHPLAHLEMRTLLHPLDLAHGAFAHAELVNHWAEQAAHDLLAHRLTPALQKIPDAPAGSRSCPHTVPLTRLGFSRPRA